MKHDKTKSEDLVTICSGISIKHISPGVDIEKEIHDYLSRILQGTIYQPQDVVGIVLGSADEFNGNKIESIMMTPRGVIETQDSKYAAFYNNLRKGVNQPAYNFHTLINTILDGVLEDFKARTSGSRPQFIELPEKDEHQRILVVYIIDRTYRPTGNCIIDRSINNAMVHGD